VSQFGQDQFLDQELFGGAEGLFFVEIGSADPVQINNTYFLETQRGWRGLLIEARPSACEQLRSQRASEVINACVADQKGRASTPTSSSTTPARIRCGPTGWIRCP